MLTGRPGSGYRLNWRPNVPLDIMRNVAHDVDMSNAATPADTAALEADAATPHLTPMVGRDDLWPAPVTARTARFVTLSDSGRMAEALEVLA